MRRALSFLLAGAVLLPLLGCSSATPTPAAPAPDGPPPDFVAIPDAPDLDLPALARGYRGVTALPLSQEQLYPQEPVGQGRAFWVVDIVDLEARQVPAVLRHIGERALWYVATDVEVPQDALELAARRFDNEVYPLVVGAFSGEARPEGPITVLHAQLQGAAGYVSSVDRYPAAVHSYSNERAMLYIDAGAEIGSGRHMGTLAHELQHLIHGWVDPGEETWVNEGLSEVAAALAGFPRVAVDRLFLSRPDTPLIRWPEAPLSALANYGGASLFLRYLMERTGGDGSLSRLVAEPADGITGVQAYLAAVAPHLSFEALFADWVVANYVGATSGRYGYDRPEGPVLVEGELKGPGRIEGQVPQYGAQYISVETSSPLEITFTGAIHTPLLPLVPHSGEACWWSNRGDSIDATLTRTMDLTNVTRATLRFWMWHRIEETWDYGYVAVSTDGGLRWRVLEGEHTVSENPLGNALGPGYTGRTDGWVEERIDLTPFAGRPVQLRFEYVADETVNGDGLCLDDISIPELGFNDDAESDGGWTARGFVRVPGNRVPQAYVVRLVRGAGDDAVVEELTLDAGNRGAVVVREPAVLVVAAMAPKTGQPAPFVLEARPAP